jgi:hypothetical protein
MPMVIALWQKSWDWLGVANPRERRSLIAQNT